ncbi:hypothetical protein JCM5296_001558 [Sporobolomyces johnsonii]
MSDNEVTPAALGSTPAALRLPDELWLDILTQRGLTYGHLRKAGRICKRLQRLLQSEELDALLFRQGPPSPPLVQGSKLKVHPMLELTECVFTDFSKALMFCPGPDGPDDKHCIDYPRTLNEFATAPASSIINIQFPVGRAFSISGKNGVKLKQVLVHIGKFWSKKPPSYVAQQVAPLQGVLPDEVNWRMCLGDHCFFEGWDSVVANGRNTTTMSAIHFGS